MQIHNSRMLQNFITTSKHLVSNFKCIYTMQKSQLTQLIKSQETHFFQIPSSCKGQKVNSWPIAQLIIIHHLKSWAWKLINQHPVNDNSFSWPSQDH